MSEDPGVGISRQAGLKKPNFGELYRCQMSILRHRLHNAVVRLRRFTVAAVAMTVIMFAVMVVVVGMFERYRGRLKKMMHPMRRGGRKEDDKEGEDSQSADGTKIMQCCCFLLNERILIKKSLKAQAPAKNNAGAAFEKPRAAISSP